MQVPSRKWSSARWRLICIVAAAAPVGSVVHAELLFDNGISVSSIDDLGYNDENVLQRVFEEFSFNKAVGVNGISFVGGYFPDNTPQTDAFHVVFLNDVSGLPDRNSPVADVPLPSVSRTASG